MSFNNKGPAKRPNLPFQSFPVRGTNPLSDPFNVAAELSANIGSDPKLDPTAKPAPIRGLRPEPQPVSKKKTPTAADIRRMSAAAQPDLQAAQKPKSDEDARNAAANLLEGRKKDSALPVTATAPSLFPALNLQKRAEPLIPGVTFSKTVTRAHKKLFSDSLTRRKAGWMDLLKSPPNRFVKVFDLKSPVEPALTVLSAAADKSNKKKVTFVAHWLQGETHEGTFAAVLEGIEPVSLYHQDTPPPPEAQQILLSFQNSTPPETIVRFLDAQKLRLIDESHTKPVVYRVAVVGKDKASDKAQKISSSKIVLYATPKTLSAPNQIEVVLKKSWSGKTLPTDKGLQVLGIKTNYYTSVTLGAKKLDAVKTTLRLQKNRDVFYAVAAKFDPPGQLVVALRNSTPEDAISGLLKRHGLVVTEAIDLAAFRVAQAAGPKISVAKLAARLSAEKTVMSVTRVGRVKDAKIAAEAKKVVSSLKSARDSSSEDLAQASGIYTSTYDSLARAGATSKQLKRFSALCGEK